MKKVKIDRSRYYYKIINANYGHPESMQYHLGLNETPRFSKKLHRGIYFTDIKHIFAYVNYGPIVCQLTIPEDATWEYFKSQFDDGTLSEDVFYRVML